MTLAKLVTLPFILILVFMILLTLKLEDKNLLWFHVFIPLLLLKTIALLYIGIKTTIRVCKQVTSTMDTKRNIFYMVMNVVEILAMVLPCLKLDGFVPTLHWTVAFIPVWIALLGYIGNFTKFQVQVLRQGENLYGNG